MALSFETLTGQYGLVNYYLIAPSFFTRSFLNLYRNVEYYSTISDDRNQIGVAAAFTILEAICLHASKMVPVVCSFDHLLDASGLFNRLCPYWDNQLFSNKVYCILSYCM